LGRFLPAPPKLLLVLQSFSTAFFSINKLSDSAKDCVLVHQGKKVIDTKILITQLNEIASKVLKFASLLPCFRTIHDDDKAALLQTNVKLYFQYVLARYFSSNSGPEQLSWILQDNLSHKQAENLKIGLTEIRLSECEHLNKMFYSSEFAKIYADYCNDIGFLYNFSPKCNGLVAQVILFNTNGINSLTEPEKIKHLFGQSKELLEMGQTYFNGSQQRQQQPVTPTLSNIDPLISSLKSMQTIFRDVYSK
jgi:hypothetical protein